MIFDASRSTSSGGVLYIRLLMSWRIHPEWLLEQMLGDHHALDLIRSLVDLGVLALTSTLSTEPLVIWRFVQYVFHIIDGSPEL
jgi:hypothetical protein